MAGDWIKMREDLHEDPAVLWMAQQLNVRPETIVGFCHRFWGLVSRQTWDGCLKGPTIASLGSVLGLSGFPELLVRCGWLQHDDSDPDMPVTTIPKFERHLSEGAKARALEAERKREQRTKSRPKMSQKSRDICPSMNGTREEKRRVSNTNVLDTRAKFVKPTLEQVKAYCQERNRGVDAEKWYAHYEANGWKVGRNAMKDWKAAVRTWEGNEFSSVNGQPQAAKGTPVFADRTKRIQAEYREMKAKAKP